MNDLKIEGTQKTPEMEFDFENSSIVIKGRAIPENAIEFFSPLNEALRDYSPKPGNKLEISVQLEYFNTSSSKAILDIFKLLEDIKERGHEVSVQWVYEKDDEDMLEAGEDYQAIISIPFEMKEVEEW